MTIKELIAVLVVAFCFTPFVIANWLYRRSK